MFNQKVILDYLCYINSLGFLFLYCFSLTEGQCIKTLDYTIHISSTPTFLYFDLYLYSAYAAHYVYLTKKGNWFSLCTCQIDQVHQFNHFPARPATITPLFYFV